MKNLKLLITLITLLSVAIISGCSSTSNADYVGKWYAYDSKGNISKLIIEKQEKNFLVTHKDYNFWYQDIFDRKTQPYIMHVSLIKTTHLENKLLPIKENVLELNERDGQGSLIYKNGKFVGKPNPSYKEELTFEKDMESKPNVIFEKAKQKFEKYISTREKAPQDTKKIKYHVDINSEDYDFVK